MPTRNLKAEEQAHALTNDIEDAKLLPELHQEGSDEWLDVTATHERIIRAVVGGVGCTLDTARHALVRVLWTRRGKSKS